MRDGAAVYLSAVLQQITTRLLEKAGAETGDGAAADSGWEAGRGGGGGGGGRGEPSDRDSDGGEEGGGGATRRIVPKAIQKAIEKDPLLKTCLDKIMTGNRQYEKLKSLQGGIIWVECAKAHTREEFCASLVDELGSAGLEARLAASPTPAPTRRLADACSQGREG